MHRLQVKEDLWTDCLRRKNGCGLPATMQMQMDCGLIIHIASTQERSNAEEAVKELWSHTVLSINSRGNPMQRKL
eukprot:1159926-Pelagomonas_calceolata.AAC.7